MGAFIRTAAIGAACAAVVATTCALVFVPRRGEKPEESDVYRHLLEQKVDAERECQNLREEKQTLGFENRWLWMKLGSVTQTTLEPRHPRPAGPVAEVGPGDLLPAQNVPVIPPED
jgi:hypothetical protein